MQGTFKLSPRRLRAIILEQSRRAHVGHIGSSLSVVELISAVYDCLRATGPRDPDRDRFVLSKGHAVLALYAALHLKGWIPVDVLDTFCGDGSLLGSHPDHALPGVDFSTGSLGHGLCLGTGAALAARLQGSKRRIFVLVSDAECNEGSLWEAVMSAAHNNLANLIVLIDLNGQQALGYTRAVLGLEGMAERWRKFGWDVHEVDGHDVAALVATIRGLETQSGPPHVLVARTVFGKGVSYMENQIRWHYWPMSPSDYRQAMSEIGCPQ